MVMDQTAGIAESPRDTDQEWPEPAVEEGNAALRGRTERASHLRTAVSKAPHATPAEDQIVMGGHRL